MIYAHNQSITGINANLKSIDRVYKGERLVWLRNSTSDHFDIVGSDTIVGGIYKLYRIRYAGSDDVSYTWSFSNVTPEIVTYNHNKKKAIVKIAKREHIGEYMVISVVMRRVDGTTLTATKNVLVLENTGIESFTIDDILFDVNDSSCYVDYNIIPEDYPFYSVYDSSVDDSRLYVSEYVDGGLYVSKVSPEDSSLYSTKLYVSIVDEDVDVPYEAVILEPEKYVQVDGVWRRRFDASANLHVVSELETFIINNEYLVGKGENLNSKIKIGVIVSPDVIYTYYDGAQISSINIYNSDGYNDYGLYGVYEMGTDVPYGSSGLRRLSTYSKYLYRNVVHWIDYDASNGTSTYVPTLAEKRGSNICAYVSIMCIGGDEIRQRVEIPQQFTNIENNIARYVFRISNGENGIVVTFDTELSSVLSC